MADVRRVSIAADDDAVFDDAEALIALARRSFSSAAQDAVEENDRLGIPTHGAIGGELVVRQPRKSGGSR